MTNGWRQFIDCSSTIDRDISRNVPAAVYNWLILHRYQYYCQHTCSTARVSGSDGCQSWHATKCGAGRIWTVTICGSLGPIWRSLITVGLRLGLGLGLRIVLYKLLEKVTKCESITWLKLTDGVPPRRSTPFRILSCPVNHDFSGK